MINYFGMLLSRIGMSGCQSEGKKGDDTAQKFCMQIPESNI